jgi:hypothetical protein
MFIFLILHNGPTVLRRKNNRIVCYLLGHIGQLVWQVSFPVSYSLPKGSSRVGAFSEILEQKWAVSVHFRWGAIVLFFKIKSKLQQKLFELIGRLCRTQHSLNNSYCSGQQEPEYSRGRLCKALGSWGSGNLEGRGGVGKGWVKVGQFITNLGLRWTFLSQLEGAK